MSKQQRHERKKTERTRRRRTLFRNPKSAIRNGGAAAIAAAAVIAAGTQAYAAPVRFDNPPGEGHFDWFGAVMPELRGLDMALDAPNQTGVFDGPTQFAQTTNPTYGIGGGIGYAGDFAVGGPYNLFFIGANSGDLIPRGLPRSNKGYTFYPGLGSQLREGQATYLGVRFDLGGGDQYGWIGVVRTGYQLDAFAWGYETEAGEPIPAGAPEPGSLALLAMGAAGLTARRRRPN